MGSEPKHVPESNTVKARRVSRLYNQQQMNRNIPVRRITHVIIHMSDDCEFFLKYNLKVSVRTFLKISCVSSETYFLLVKCHWNNYSTAFINFERVTSIFPLPFLLFPFFSVMCVLIMVYASCLQPFENTEIFQVHGWENFRLDWSRNYDWFRCSI